jgi:hypothetical protein
VTRTLARVKRGGDRTVAPAAAGVFVFLLTCPLLFRGGSSDGNLVEFHRYGDLIARGSIPYRDFAFEYPPGAIPLLAAPAVGPGSWYLPLFRVLAAVAVIVGIVLAVRLLARAGAPRWRLWAAALLAAAAPVLLGPFSLWRFDAWPAALTVASLLLLLERRPRAAFAVLAVATLIKTYPVVLLPVALLSLDRRDRWRALAVYCGVGLAVLLPFAAIAHAGLYNSYAGQVNRHLQVESIGSAALLALHRPVHVFFDGAYSVRGSGADTIAKAQSFVELALVALIAICYARSRRGVPELLLAATASVAVVACLGKVFSPQYLLWLSPMILLAGSGGVALLYAGALVLTNLIFPERYSALLHLQRTEVWLLVARDAAMLALTVLLVAAVWRGARWRSSNLL